MSEDAETSGGTTSPPISCSPAANRMRAHRQRQVSAGRNERLRLALSGIGMNWAFSVAEAEILSAPATDPPTTYGPKPAPQSSRHHRA
jgi:hypothetical protein